MKRKAFNKKLRVKKVTIARLMDGEKSLIRGGGTVQGLTCEECGTVYGRTCDLPDQQQATEDTQKHETLKNVKNGTGFPPPGSL